MFLDMLRIRKIQRYSLEQLKKHAVDLMISLWQVIQIAIVWVQPLQWDRRKIVSGKHLQAISSGPY